MRAAARAPSSSLPGGMRMSAIARSGSCARDGLLERLGVPHGGGHLVAGVAQQQHEPLAEQRGVLADHDPHGSTTSIRVPAPGALSSAIRPPWAATRSASPARPPAGLGRRAAAAVVLDAHHQAAVVLAGGDAHPRSRSACLTALASASLTT